MWTGMLDQHRTHARSDWPQTELKITYASSADSAELNVSCYGSPTTPVIQAYVGIVSIRIPHRAAEIIAPLLASSREFVA